MAEKVMIEIDPTSLADAKAKLVEILDLVDRINAGIDRIRPAENETTIRYRDALGGILLLANNYTMAESVRLALIAQRCKDALEGGMP